MPQVEPDKILVAEDNELNQRVIREMLRHRGYEVDVVSDGHEAIAALKSRTYSLLILDCLMPGLDGFATAQMVRNAGPGSMDRTIPILATTALSSEYDCKRCLKAGMNDYLIKPIKAKVLFDRVERLLAGFPKAARTSMDAALPDNKPERADSIAIDKVVNSMGGQLALDAQRWQADFTTYLENQDWVAIRNLAHKIRGAADIIGLRDLSSLTAALEKDAKLQDEPAVAEALARVVPELGRMREALGKRQ